MPGCITTGKTVDETLRNMQEALSGHLELMLKDGEPLTRPVTQTASALGDQDVVGFVDVRIEVLRAS